MLVEKDTIKCEAVFDDDKTHRFLWKRVWNKDKPVISVIALNPSLSDNIITDTTTALIVNNVAELGEYGGVEILNLFSVLTPKLRIAEIEENLDDEVNDSYILKSVEGSAKAIIAWGRAADSNAKIEERAVHVINLLQAHKDKLYTISDGVRSALHPLTPSVRGKWILEKCVFPANTEQ